MASNSVLICGKAKFKVARREGMWQKHNKLDVHVDPSGVMHGLKPIMLNAFVISSV